MLSINYNTALGYQQRWREHLRTVPIGAKDDGIPQAARDVLAQSDNTSTMIRLEFGQVSIIVPLQRTPHTETAKRLERAGLIVIIEYHPATVLGPDGQPVGREGVSFTWTPYGIKLAQAEIGVAAVTPV